MGGLSSGVTDPPGKGPEFPPLKYHYSQRFFTYPVRRVARRRGPLAGHVVFDFCWCQPFVRLGRLPFGGVRRFGESDPFRRNRQAGSLTGAVHLSNGNAGVPRRAQRGQKPRVEQKGKSSLDLDFQYEYRPRKRGLSILLTNVGIRRKGCQKSYHRDNWLVAAKRS